MTAASFWSNAPTGPTGPGSGARTLADKLRSQRKVEKGAINVAEEPSRAYGRGPSRIPSGFSGVLILLTVGFGRCVPVFCARRHRPDRPCDPAQFSAGTGGTLASPMEYWQSDSGHIDGVDRISCDDRVQRSRRAGNILAGRATAGIPFEPRVQDLLAAGDSTWCRGVAPRHVNGPGTWQGTEAIRTEISASAGDRSANSASPAEPAKPVPVAIQSPEFGPLQIVQTIVGPLLQPLAMAGLVVVLVVLILLEREDLRDRLLRLAGRRDLHRTTVAMDDAARRISRYLSRQLVVNACCGLPIGFGLALIGIPNAALWAIFAALLRFVPYLGIVIAACFPVALALAVDPGWMLLVWVILLFVAVELVVANLLEPWVYGASTGLSPVALIAAATFWTWLWGPVGLLLSTPLTVCLVVLGRHVPQLQFLDVMLGNQPVLAPDETFYQRLLANDPEEATEQAEEFAKERSLAEFFDEVAVPALIRAQVDSDEGALLPERRLMIKEGIRAILENLSDQATGDPPPGHPTPPIIEGDPRGCLQSRPKRARRSCGIVAGAPPALGTPVARPPKRCRRRR